MEKAITRAAGLLILVIGILITVASLITLPFIALKTVIAAIELNPFSKALAWSSAVVIIAAIIGIALGLLLIWIGEKLLEASK